MVSIIVGVGVASIPVLGGGAPTFTPASLILPGDVGGVMDASDLSSLYQESAGITPVTSDGDPTGLVINGTGDAPDVRQATDSARPTYRVSGGVKYLEYNAVNSSLAMDVTSIPQPFTVAMALRLRSFSGNAEIYRTASTRAVGYTNSAASNSHALFAGSVLDSGVSADTAFHVRVDQFGGASSSIRLDGSVIAAGAAGSQALTAGEVLFVGGRPGKYPALDLAFFFVVDRLLDADETESLEAYMAGLI